MEIRQDFEDPAAFEAVVVKNPAEVRQDFDVPFAKEKPLVSGRFGQRKCVKASPEGKWKSNEAFELNLFGVTTRWFCFARLTRAIGFGAC